MKDHSSKPDSMPWSRLLLEFDIDNVLALKSGARAGLISAPNDWRVEIATDADREVDILRMEPTTMPSLNAGAAILRDLVDCGAITRPAAKAFASLPHNNACFKADPKRPLFTKKMLAELLGWEGLSIAVPSFGGSAGQAICITSPQTGRLIEANIPSWDSEWQAYGDLILEHQIQVSPGTHCVTAGAVSNSGALVSGTYDYADHPSKSAATMFAAMATCIAKLELDAQATPIPSSRKSYEPT